MTLDASLFISDEIKQKEVTLPNGQVHTLYFKELPAVEFRRFQIAETSGKEDVQAGSIAKLISASLVEPDGKPAISYTKALQLNSAAANAIIAAILEVNGFGAKND
jgi:hypothetical protein